MNNILQCNYNWVTIYNYTFVTENKFLLLCSFVLEPKQRYLGQQERVPNQLQHSKYPACSVTLGQAEHSCGCSSMDISRSNGDPRARVTDLPPCSQSRGVGKEKHPAWIKRSGGQKVSQQVDHGRGTSKTKGTKCSKITK